MTEFSLWKFHFGQRIGISENILINLFALANEPTLETEKSISTQSAFEDGSSGPEFSSIGMTYKSRQPTTEINNVIRGQLHQSLFQPPWNLLVCCSRRSCLSDQ